MFDFLAGFLLGSISRSVDDIADETGADRRDARRQMHRREERRVKIAQLFKGPGDKVPPDYEKPTLHGQKIRALAGFVVFVMMSASIAFLIHRFNIYG
jgi:hypothetical protein